MCSLTMYFTGKFNSVNFSHLYAFSQKSCNEYDKSRTTAFYLYGDCGNSGQGGKLGNNKLCHRGCCHKEKGGFQTEDYLSPVQMAIEESMENLGNPQEMNLPKPLSHIHSKYKEATKQERIWFNKSVDAGTYR